MFRSFAWFLFGWISISNALMVTVRKEVLEEFFNTSAHFNVGHDCKEQLNKVFLKYLSHLSLESKVPPILSSFSIGRSDELVGETRWLHNMLKCFWANPEYNETRSFCYGYDDESAEDLRASGICIPRQCANDKIELLKEWTLITTKKPVNINHATCTNSRHERPWYLGLAPLIHIIWSVLFTTMITFATIHHSKLQKSRSFSAQLLFAFSMKRNLQKMVQLPKDPRSTITCMFGLRFFSMIWTLIGHCFSWIQAYVDNVEEFRDHMTDNFWNILITNFNLGVDTFFVLSATLTSYTWFNNQYGRGSAKNPPTWKSWKHWLVFYRHRLFRLWPAYLLTLSLITYFFSELHSHPMWPPADPSVQCRKYGWQNVLFINSLLGNNCMGWTWYISTEFMFFLVSPIFLLALSRSSQFGLLFCGTAIAISSSLKLNIMADKNYPPIPLHFRASKFFSGTFIQQVDDYYIKPQYRIGPYVIGLMLGYELFCFQKEKKKNKPSLQLQVTGWCTCILLGCWSLLGAYPTMKDINLPLFNLIYGTTHRIFWSISVAWVVYACHTGIGGIINTVLSYKFLIPLSSLCYSVYLIHLLIVFAIFMWSPFPLIFTSKLPILLLTVPQLFLSYVAAILISLYAEFPAINIENLIFSKKAARKEESRTDEDDEKKRIYSDRMDAGRDKNNNLLEDINNNYISTDK